MIIPGFSKYDIDTNGVVTDVATGTVVKANAVRIRNRKYMQIRLRDDDGYVSIYNVLALLALAYLGKPLHEGVATTKDGNNLNTTLDNVVWSTHSDVAKQSWKDDRLNNRRPRPRCYNEDSVAMVYEAMQAYDEPVAMTVLSGELLVPYNTIRYSMRELVNAGKVRRTKDGFEVIR